MSNKPPDEIATTSVDTRVLLVTCPSNDLAEAMATQLLEANLVACVNIIPNLTSLYRWQGEIQRDEEVLMMIKTTQINVRAVEALLQSKHPYDVFECLSLPVDWGSRPYLDWVCEQTTVSG